MCAVEDEHCQESIAPDCTHEEPEVPQDGGCGHESDCDSDPCSTPAVAREQWDDATPLLAPVLLTMLPAPIVDDPSDRQTDRWIVGKTEVDSVSLRAHPSDLPLLI